MAAKKRFERYSAAERNAVLRRYRAARAKGQSPTAAARQAGTDLTTLERWEADEAAPVAVIKNRQCLGCSTTFRSGGNHNRLCPKCSGAIAALPRAWSA